MHDYLSKAKSSNFHYFVLSRGTVRGTPGPIVIAGEKSRLLHSLIYYTLALYRGFVRKGARVLGHNIIVVANRH